MRQIALLITFVLLFSCTPNETKQCQAITKKGTQCTRKTEKGSDFCWQHKKMKDDGKTVRTIKD